MRKGEWQVTTSYLRFYSDKHYIGEARNFAITPYAGPVNIRNQFNLDLTYALTTRWNISLDVPVQFQSYDLHRVVAASGSTQPVPVNTGANGIGDITLRGGYWLLSTEHARGNTSSRSALQMPTGNDAATSLVYGRAVPVDISVQPGSGGWLGCARRTGFPILPPGFDLRSGDLPHRPARHHRDSAFFSALNSPTTTNVNSSTDQYFAEFGAGLNLRPRWLSPGCRLPPTRMSGVPVRDLIGASDGFRRPANLQISRPRDGHHAPGTHH